MMALEGALLILPFPRGPRLSQGWLTTLLSQGCHCLEGLWESLMAQQQTVSL